MFSNKNRSQNIKLNHFFRKGCCISDDDDNNKLCFWNGWPTKAVKPYFQPDHCQGFSQSRLSGKPQAGFETAENQPEFKVHHCTSYTWQTIKLIHEHKLERGFQALHLAVEHFSYKKWWYTETSSIPKIFFVISRSSHPEMFCQKDVLKNFTKFTGKQLCQSLFFNKVVGLRPATLLKKRLWDRCFPMNFVKFLRSPLFILNTSYGCFWISWRHILILRNF